METQFKYDVFISYSRRDYIGEDGKVIPNNIVSQIKQKLEQEKISYWFDEEGIYSGDAFAKNIAKAIKGSAILLFLSTKNSNGSVWTSREIATANEFGRKIIPFRVDNSTYNEEVIIYLANLDYIDYQANPDKAFERLVESIKSNLEQQRREEAKRRKAEMARDRAKEEERKRKIAEIELAIEKLGNDEAKIDVVRTNIALAIKEIDNEEERKRLQGLVDNSGTLYIRHKQAIRQSADEHAAKKNRVAELEAKNEKIARERDELQKNLQRERDTIATMKKDGVVSAQMEKKQKDIKKKFWVYRFLLVLAAIVICALLFWSRSFIVFAGGGSVANFLKDTTRGAVDIRTYPNSVYINVPSESAWQILSGEANLLIENGGAKQQSFMSICLSADELDSTFIAEKNKTFFKGARIIGYKMGSDPLVVYAHKDLVKAWSLAKGDSVITSQELATHLREILDNPTTARIFTTSKTSGTLRLYQKCLAEVDTTLQLERMLEKRQSLLFFKASSSEFINSLGDPDNVRPYVILGSRHYYAERLDNTYEKLYVADDNGRVEKHMYLYFLANIDKVSDDFCRVRQPIIEFLKKIDAQEHIAKNYWSDLVAGRIKLSGQDIIDISKR